MNGSKSRVSSTSAQMFPNVVAAFCFNSLVRSRNPRKITGKTTASDGASIELTNVVSMSLSKQSSVAFCGVRMASKMRSSMPKTSAFFTHAQIVGRISWHSADTLGWVSKSVSRKTGKSSGMVRMNDCGTRLARSPMM